MIDSSPEVPREYFLNCSETGKQIRVTCLKAAGENVMIEVATGAVLYGAAKGLGLLGISATMAVGATAGVVAIGGAVYGILKEMESVNKSCQENHETALNTAWTVYASYHDKKLADIQKRSKTCVQFLSGARRRAREILIQIQRKKI